MSKYILEIKNRLFLLCVTCFSTLLVSYSYKEILLFLVVQPSVYTSSTPFYFIFTDVTEIFYVYIQLITFLSIQITILYMSYHLFIFLSPALFRVEYVYFNYIIKLSVSLWFYSAILSNYIIIPLTWNFFLSFQSLTLFKSVNLYFEAKISEYLNFYILLYSLCILYCQIFIVFYFYYINADVTVIKKFRKINYYFFVLFSTMVSPPEILSQVLISIALIFMYEFFLFIFIFKASTKFIN